MSRVLLAPGLLCDARLWNRIIPFLQDDFEALDFSSAGSLSEMAEIIIECAGTHTGSEPIVLAGFSMGAFAAILASDLLRQSGHQSRLTGLLLIASHAEPETIERSLNRRRQIDLVQTIGITNFVQTEIAPAYFGHRKPEEIRPDLHLTQIMAEGQGESIFRKHVMAITDRPSLKDIIERCNIPIHVLAGDQDRLVPTAWSKSLAECAPLGQIEILQDCGHMIPLERPDAVLKAIQSIQISNAKARSHVQYVAG